MIETIVQRMTQGEINPLKALREIDVVLDRVISSKYGTGKKNSVKITGNAGEVKIPVRGDSRTREQLVELATLAYWLAIQNGNYQRPGEVHIDSQRSSKHHQKDRGGFREYTQNLLQRYSAA